MLKSSGLVPSIFLILLCLGPCPGSAAGSGDGGQPLLYDDPGLKRYLEQNSGEKNPAWPPAAWDIRLLSFAALYYDPALAAAKSDREAERAGLLSARLLRNPSAEAVPQYTTNAPSGVSPWIADLNLNIPVKTAGKRKYDIAAAQNAYGSAEHAVFTESWNVCYKVRVSLINRYKAENETELLRRRAKLFEKMSSIISKRFEAGGISPVIAAQAQIALDRELKAVRESQKRIITANSLLAQAVGVPLRYIDSMHITYDFLSADSLPADVPSDRLKKYALANRSDLNSLTARLAAQRDVTRLERANRYPDFTIGPDYTFDQGANEWGLKLTAMVPVFSHNQGAIQQARARSSAIESRIDALRSSISDNIDLRVQEYLSDVRIFRLEERLCDDKKLQYRALGERLKPSSGTELSLLNAELQVIDAELSRLNAFVAAGSSLAVLENTVQRPLNPALTAWLLKAVRCGAGEQNER